MSRYSEAEEATFAEFLAEFRRVFESNTRFLLTAMAAMTAAYSAWDLAFGEASQFFMQIAIAIFAQYYVTERLLLERLPDGCGSRRYGAIFGSGILSGLAIAFGLVFFLLPGVFLMGRWSMVAPLVVAENCSSGQSLNESWERSSRSSTQLFLVYLVWGFCYLVALGTIGGIAGFAGGVSTLVETIAANTVVSVLSILGWTLAVAIYLRLTPGSGGLDEVFS